MPLKLQTFTFWPPDVPMLSHPTSIVVVGALLVLVDVEVVEVDDVVLEDVVDGIVVNDVVVVDVVLDLGSA
jgi:hypothetical protein